MNNTFKKEQIKDCSSNNESFFFNTHTHIFNFDHVNHGFLKNYLPTNKVIIVSILILLADIRLLMFFISWRSFILLKYSLIILTIIVAGLVVYFFYIFLFLPRLPWILQSHNFLFIIKKLAKISPKSFDRFERYANLIHHSYYIEEKKTKKQKTILKRLQSYYPKNTKFVTLTMDMDYMVDGNKPQKSSFDDQLNKIINLKKDPDYKNIIYPFIHVDPRRLKEDSEFIEKIKQYVIEDGYFQGFKIYPALGYFPFDLRLKEIYDLAIDYSLPITTHCSVGPVFYRGKLSDFEGDGYYDSEREEFVHPFTNNKLKGKNAAEFTPHFTHPLNYYCLMHEHKKLAEYWTKCGNKNDGKSAKVYKVKDVKKYKDLKINFGHYGGSNQWEKFLKDAWLPDNSNQLVIDSKLCHMPNGEWGRKNDDKKCEDTVAFSWNSIISEMIYKKDKNKKPLFKNLYADIAYNLSNEELLPLLKIRLETDEILASKILFGTDFYMVSTQASEREMTLNLRAYIGEDNFNKIACRNPLEFLKSNLTKYEDLIKIDSEK